MGERIDDPSVLFHFPVHVRPGGGAGHADERDGLAARNAVADRHERGGRVVVAALDAFGVLDADAPAADLDPTRGVDDTVVRGDDDRTERSGEVDPGVTALKELADRASDRTDEAARGALDAREARAGGWVGAQVDALPARDAAAVELELRLVKAGPGHADVPLRRAVEVVARDGESLRVRAEVRVVAGIPRDEVRVDVGDRLSDPVAPDADLVVIPEIQIVAAPADFR